MARYFYFYLERNNAEWEHEKLQRLLHLLLLETEIEMREVFGQYMSAGLSEKVPGENIELLPQDHDVGGLANLMKPM